MQSKNILLGFVFVFSGCLTHAVKIKELKIEALKENNVQKPQFAQLNAFKKAFSEQIASGNPVFLAILDELENSQNNIQ